MVCLGPVRDVSLYAHLREKHFAPFPGGSAGGALTADGDLASVNGVPMHANKEFLTGWLKQEMGMGWCAHHRLADINNLYTREMVARTRMVSHHAV